MQWWLLIIGLIVGILATIVVDYKARVLYDWRQRPILKHIKDSELPVWVLRREIEIYPLGSQDIADKDKNNPAKAWAKVTRLKINNEGRSAAVNVQGTIELKRPEPQKSHVQHICWYEQSNKSSITINAKGSSYLDLYAVPERDEYKGTIVIAVEHGWGNPSYATKLEGNEKWRLRVSAANCDPLELGFDIDSEKRELLNVNIFQKCAHKRSAF